MSASKPPFDSIRELIASMPEASESSRDAVRARQAELTKIYENRILAEKPE